MFSINGIFCANYNEVTCGQVSNIITYMRDLTYEGFILFSSFLTINTFQFLILGYIHIMRAHNNIASHQCYDDDNDKSL